MQGPACFACAVSAVVQVWTDQKPVQRPRTGLRRIFLAVQFGEIEVGSPSLLEAGESAATADGAMSHGIADFLLQQRGVGGDNKSSNGCRQFAPY